MPQQGVVNPVRTAADAAAWAIAVAIVWTILLAMGAPTPLWVGLGYLLVAVLGQYGTGGLLAYRGRYRVSTFDELVAVGRAMLVTALVAGLVGLLIGAGLGTVATAAALAVLAPAIALAAMVGSRAWWRRRLEGLDQRDDNPDGQRALVYGAGEAGEQLLRLLRGPDAPYRVVALLDDDPRKRNLRVLGVPVRGSGADLDRVLDEHEPQAVILAIGRPDRDLVASLTRRLSSRGVALRVLPPVAQIVDGQVRISDVREVDVADILGRRPISTDVAAVAEYLRGRRVLVTGAGGSIGSELARQLHHLAPAELVLLDRDESALHAVQLSIYGQGMLDTPDIVLADIRDADALRRAFESHRPEVVFHAAALKHLPMLEQYPEEAWLTNVLGTERLLALAREVGVQRFITISTDKAADPSSVLGRSKLLAERLTAWWARSGDPRLYVSVRFGNVLGSRGSMLEAFRYQVAAGGPVTVTDPDVTRYFMTIPEACELVIQAAAIGRPGEVLVLDMGEPVRILDVARLLIERSGSEIPIVFTGLRPGEKLHEDLFSAAEQGERPFHRLISHVSQSPLDPADLGSEHTAWPSAAEPVTGRSTGV